MPVHARHALQAFVHSLLVTVPAPQLLHRRVVVGLRDLERAELDGLALLRRCAAWRQRGLGHVEARVQHELDWHHRRRRVGDVAALDGFGAGGAAGK